jgi:hypothetical protein
MSNVIKPDIGIEQTRAGDSWRVRITEPQRTQYISGFDSEEQAASWIAQEADAWLGKLRRLEIGR